MSVAVLSAVLSDRRELGPEVVSGLARLAHLEPSPEVYAGKFEKVGSLQLTIWRSVPTVLHY